MWKVYRNHRFTGIIVSNYKWEIEYLKERSRLTGDRYDLVKI